MFLICTTPKVNFPQTQIHLFTHSQTMLKEYYSNRTGNSTSDRTMILLLLTELFLLLTLKFFLLGIAGGLYC